MASGSPVFIVSTGRAGSNMIARVLAAHPALFSIHEPLPDLNTEAYSKWAGRHGRAKILAHIGHKRGALIEQVEHNGLLYVEASHFCAHLIPELAETYHARFIHLYRDGRDFVRSGLERPRWYAEEGRSRLAVALEFVKRQARRQFLIDVGSTWDDHKLAPPISMRSRAEKIAWLWVEINRVILESLAALPREQSMSLALEQLQRDSLIRVLDFIGVEADAPVLERMVRIAETKPNRTRVRRVPPVEEWSGHERTRFSEIAGAMMRKLGYTV